MDRLEPGELTGWAETEAGGNVASPAMGTVGGAAGVVCLMARRSAASCFFSGTAVGEMNSSTEARRVEVSAFANDRSMLGAGVGGTGTRLLGAGVGGTWTRWSVGRSEGGSIGVRPADGRGVSEVMGWLATDWNCSSRAGTPIVAWKVAKPGDEDEGEGWTVAVGVTAGARATAGSGRT